jgi:hypothetical protein
MHLVGMQEDKSGCFVHPSAINKFKPFNYIKTKFLLKASGVSDLHHADQQAKDHLNELIDSFPEIPYYGLAFAFAAGHNRDDHKMNRDKTSFYVPNSVPVALAEKNPKIIPVGSIHPFQEDLEEQFQYLSSKGVKFLKILPNSMHFNPEDDECENFFQKAEEYGMTVITHVGHENSVSYAGIENAHGNPLLYKRWLEKFPKLKIIFAHVGSEGKSEVTMNGKKKRVDNFDLVLSILRDPKFRDRVYADISAFTISPLRTKYLKNF